MKGKGRAGKALSAALAQNKISQNKLATQMNVGRASVNQWVRGLSDPAADVIPDIMEALDELSPGLSVEFVEAYLYGKVSA